VLAASAALERVRPWHDSYDVLVTTEPSEANVGAGSGKVG
jgi:hypothetical protein